MSDLTTEQVGLLGRVADALLVSSRGALVPTQLSDFPDWVVRAARARSRDPAAVAEALGWLDANDLEASLRAMDAAAKDRFELVASIAVGAYTMHPDVMAAVGYPARARAPIPYDQSADELSSGVLDPVAESPRTLLRPAPG